VKTLLVRVALLGALAAVVWFALLPLRGPVSPLHDDAIDGTLTVAAGGSREFQIPVFFSLETNPIVQVDVRPIGAAAGDLDVVVLDDLQMTPWRSKLPIEPMVARSGSQVSFTAPLPHPVRGDFMGLSEFWVVLSNRRSPGAAKLVQVRIRHEWIPTAQIRMRQGVMLLGYVLVTILALVVLTWRRKPRSTPEGYAVPPAKTGS
jgi:hypothetical protein